jgi:hypothetical protein
MTQSTALDSDAPGGYTKVAAHPGLATVIKVAGPSQAL